MLRSRRFRKAVGRAGRERQAGRHVAAGDSRWQLGVKVPFHQSSEEEVRLATAFQEAAYAAGVATPRVRRTTEGSVFATIQGMQVRVYEWVDLRAPDRLLDPALVGAVVAAIHQVSVPALGQFDAWYHEPVGADR